jgi:hypothetical protein
MHYISGRKIVLSASAVLLLLLVPGCEHESTLVTPTTLEPKLSSIQSNIFSTTCAVSGCHLGASAPLGLDLSAGSSFAKLVGVPSGQVPALKRVDPSKPDDSYLIAKIEGNAKMLAGTQRMPFGRAALSAEQINAIRQWISAGAAND